MTKTTLKAPFVHHVYFWLNRPGNNADRDALVAGLQKLRTAPDIVCSHIGTPAETDRDVVDSSYAVSWLVVFDSSGAQDRYQDDPIHLAFIRDCAKYWARVQVYDTLEI